jgi:hypothetical protein
MPRHDKFLPSPQALDPPPKTVAWPDPAEVGQVFQAWLPKCVRKLPELDMNINKDTSFVNLGVTAEMEHLRAKIDRTFGWEQGCLSDKILLQRAAAQGLLLLHDRVSDEGRNELLQTKLFTLLLVDRYRSRVENLSVHSNGAWTRTNTVTASALDWTLAVLRLVQSYFLLLAHDKPKREYAELARELLIRTQMDLRPFSSKLITGTPPPRSPVRVNSQSLPIETAT